MKDNVNIPDSQRTLVPVRPFLINVLARCEERLVEKQRNALESWDRVELARLMRAATLAHSEAELARFRGDAAHTKKKLADAINYLGMAYDTIEQQEAEGE